MRSLRSLVKSGLPQGQPLPEAYRSLTDNGIRFNRSSLAVLAGTPGCGKTMLALNIVSRLEVPTLFFSNDSSESTVASRMISRVVDRTGQQVEDHLVTHKDWAAEQLKGLDHIRWSFNPAPTLAEIEAETNAFEELYGEYPHLVVVDVVMKVGYYEESEHATLSRVMAYLDSLARKTGACVLAVAHTSEAVSGSPCQPMSAVLQKTNQLPSLILTVASLDDRLFISPVKVRGGRGDASGGIVIPMDYDPAHARIEDPGD